VARHHSDDHQVVDHRKREEGRVEEANQEQPGAAERDRHALHPIHETLHRLKCTSDRINPPSQSRASDSE